MVYCILFRTPAHPHESYLSYVLIRCPYSLFFSGYNVLTWLKYVLTKYNFKTKYLHSLSRRKVLLYETKL